MPKKTIDPFRRRVRSTVRLSSTSRAESLRASAERSPCGSAELNDGLIWLMDGLVCGCESSFCVCHEGSAGRRLRGGGSGGAGGRGGGAIVAGVVGIDLLIEQHHHRVHELPLQILGIRCGGGA